ncbi:MAG: SpoIVB peptidase [Clostridia bacterium]|nr:SpoIVB peptidase [Clostridia bacterium]
MKKTVKILTLIISLICSVMLCCQLVFPGKTLIVTAAERRYVYPGGELIGIRLRTRGVTVVGTTPFDADDGLADPATQAGIQKGDVLLSIGGEEIDSNAELTQLIEDSNGQTLETVVERNGEELHLFLTPEKTSNTGLYKGGLWVRDSAAGIGTLTFSDPVTGRIATLGHGIYDSDTEALLEVSQGEIYTASVTGITRGTPGMAGEIGGRIGDTALGSVDENSVRGVYGDVYLIENAREQVPVAAKSEVEVGAAQVICTVFDGEKQTYDIEITRLHTGSGENGMTIKITDTALLAATGGIIQGMSGSPILQNGRLVGAVTHVFVNDPKSGYAIYAEDML